MAFLWKQIKKKPQSAFLDIRAVLHLAGIAGFSYENWGTDPGGSSWGNTALFVLPILLAAGLFYADWKWVKKEDYQET